MDYLISDSEWRFRNHLLESEYWIIRRLYSISASEWRIRIHLLMLGTVALQRSAADARV